MAKKKKKKPEKTHGDVNVDEHHVRGALGVVAKVENGTLWLGMDLDGDYGETGGGNTRVASTLGNKRLPGVDDDLRFQVNLFRIVKE